MGNIIDSGSNNTNNTTTVTTASTTRDYIDNSNTKSKSSKKSITHNNNSTIKNNINSNKYKKNTIRTTMREGIEESDSSNSNYNKNATSSSSTTTTTTTLLSAESIGSLPAPGQSGPTSFAFSPVVACHTTNSGTTSSNDSIQYLSFLSNAYNLGSTTESRLCGIKMNDYLDGSNGSSTKNHLIPNVECLLREESIIDNNFQKKRQQLQSDENNNNTAATQNNNNITSLEEKLRRERQRIQVPTSGISSYIWSYNGAMILLPWRGNLYMAKNIVKCNNDNDKKEHDKDNVDMDCIYDKRMSSLVMPLSDSSNTSNSSKDGSAIDTQFSPDNKWISFVMKSDLYILPSSPSTSPATRPTRITYSNQPDVVHHGLADFLAQEEMDRYRGYWWHPLSNGIAFVRVDESVIPIYRITYQTDTTNEHHQQSYNGNQHPNPNSYEDHRYPFAGKSNPIISLGYVRITNTKCSKHNWRNVLWLNAPPEANEYLTRINYLADGNSLIAQWQNRLQNLLVIVRYDVSEEGNGASTILLKESNEYWINLHHMFRSFTYQDTLSFVFASERTGFSHLYLYSVDTDDTKNEEESVTAATCIRALSCGEWVVESIVGIDLEHEYVYVTGTYDSPLERHLYALSLSTTNTNTNTAAPPIRLTTNVSGMHTFIMDANCKFIVDTHSDIDRPTAIHVHALRYDTHTNTPVSQTLFTLFDSNVEETISATSYCYPPPQLLSFPTTDGSHFLHAALYLPDQNIYGPGPYPLISSVYGGPHVQRVSRSWSQSADMRAQRLRSLGFAVVKCDNRGSSRRGIAFESPIRHRLGRYEVLDQVTAVRYLTIRGIANPNKVGIYGWSYGGYLAAMCLCRAPDVFHAAVAGAPVTSWDGYDTHYTERYMSLPTLNPAGYTDSSLYPHIPHLKGKLMILHGLIDENVHFRHTARLVNYLIANKKEYDLVIFPDERHSPKRVRDRVYMEQRISDFFSMAFLTHGNMNSTTSTTTLHHSNSNMDTTATTTTTSNASTTTNTILPAHL